MEKRDEEHIVSPSASEVLSGADIHKEVNVSGHVPVLEKKFNLLSACATGVTTGNTWTALGGAIVSIQRCFSFVHSLTK